jgi:ADP-ribosylglycohydrolase
LGSIFGDVLGFASAFIPQKGVKENAWF